MRLENLYVNITFSMFVVIIVAFFVFAANAEIVIQYCKHKPFVAPQGYTILTYNGDYKYMDEHGYIYEHSYVTKNGAIANAWSNYERKQEANRNNWKVAE